MLRSRVGGYWGFIQIPFCCHTPVWLQLLKRCNIPCTWWCRHIANNCWPQQSLGSDISGHGGVSVRAAFFSFWKLRYECFKYVCLSCNHSLQRWRTASLQRNLGREKAKLQQGKTTQKAELYKKVLSTVSLSISPRRPLSTKHKAQLSAGTAQGTPAVSGVQRTQGSYHRAARIST